MPDNKSNNTTPEASAMVMPSREWLTDAAISHYVTSGLRTKLFDIDSVTIRDMCLRVVRDNFSKADAYRWLNKELGADVEQGDVQIVDDNAVYRFLDNFRRFYAQKRAEEARRIARLNVAEATEGNIQSMTRVSRNLLAERTTERLLEVDNLEDLTPSEQANLRANIQMQLNAEHDTAKLDLARQQAEDRARKLEADIEKINSDQRLKNNQINERLKALRSTIDELSKRAQAGRSIDPKIFTAIREELISLAPKPDTGGGDA